MRLLWICAFLPLTACSPKIEEHIEINDCAVRYTNNPGYRIILVDGAPPKRKQSTSLVTIVPYVILSSGHHVLMIENRDLKKKQIFEIDLADTSTTHYDLYYKDGRPILVSK